MKKYFLFVIFFVVTSRLSAIDGRPSARLSASGARDFFASAKKNASENIANYCFDFVARDASNGPQYIEGHCVIENRERLILTFKRCADETGYAQTIGLLGDIDEPIFEGFSIVPRDFLFFFLMFNDSVSYVGPATVSGRLVQQFSIADKFCINGMSLESAKISIDDKMFVVLQETGI